MMRNRLIVLHVGCTRPPLINQTMPLAGSIHGCCCGGTERPWQRVVTQGQVAREPRVINGRQMEGAEGRRKHGALRDAHPVAPARNRRIWRRATCARRASSEPIRSCYVRCFYVGRASVRCSSLRSHNHTPLHEEPAGQGNDVAEDLLPELEEALAARGIIEARSFGEDGGVGNARGSKMGSGGQSVRGSTAVTCIDRRA